MVVQWYHPRTPVASCRNGPSRKGCSNTQLTNFKKISDTEVKKLNFFWKNTLIFELTKVMLKPYEEIVFNI